MIPRAFLLLFLLPALAPAQSADDLLFFEKKVRPLLVEHCTSCHGEQKQKGGLRLDRRQAILTGGDSGPALVAGKVDKSLVIQAVRYLNTGDLQMPPKGKLPAEGIRILEEWVRRGAPFPEVKTSVQSKDGIDWAKGRAFWAFRPLQAEPLPKVKDAAWPRQRIDHFVRAAQEQRGLAPQGPATPTVLLRRTKFDLVGLPPTPEEIAEIQRNPEAFAEFVERWLASPQYGERWGRYWLDLARYADIPEPWADTKGQSHHYRDWVADAFTRDLPFDRFLTYQLAADLVPEAKRSDRAALGFLGLSPSYWKELQLPPEIIKAIVADEYEERVHTLTSTFLGLNVACARCHDHKFDPISAEDYYALAGVFASSRPGDLAILEGQKTEAVVKAREQVRTLESEMKKWQAKKSPDAPGKVEEFKTKLDEAKKASPFWNAPLTPGLVDARLTVLPAKGHGSVLKYDADQAQDLPLHIRGNPNKPGQIVPRRFLTVMSTNAPAPFRQGSGRLELAQAFTREGAPLVARVWVNRVWKHHFGVGLVETPSDFGIQGERPSHPELLNDLAHRFIANGWSTKWLHREIVLSAAYRQASATPAPADADFRWLSAFPRKRLEVEAWRDAMLAVTGTLDLTVGGPPQELNQASNRRRTLYGTVKRRELSDLLRLHDFPDPITHSPQRVPTTTPIQQLYALNSPLLLQQSAALVKRLTQDAGDVPEAKIRRAYGLLFGRAPTSAELQLGTAFAQTPADWQQYAQVLLASNEFLFVD